MRRRMAWGAGWSFGLVVLALSAGADTDVTTSPPDNGPGVSKPDVLLEQSLLHSATSLMYAPDNTPARGERLVALTQAAAQRDPKDPQLNALLARQYELRGNYFRAVGDYAQAAGNYAQAAAAIRVQLEHDATSAELGVAWLTLGQAARQTVEDRIAFLKDAGEDVLLPAYTRAQAFSFMGDLRLQHGDRKAAGEAYDAALKLDDRLFSALFGQFALVDRQDSAAHVNALLGLLGANPMYSGGALELGAALREQGLTEQAVFFYDFTWQLADRDFETVDIALATQYIDALLDARNYYRAIDIMVPKMDRMKTPNWEMLCQQMEAHAGVNNIEKLSNVRGQLLKEMTDALNSEPTPEMYRQLAWYFLMSDAIIGENRRQNTARDCALKAKEGPKGIDANDPVLQLVLAVVQAREAGQRFRLDRLSAADFDKQIDDLIALAEKDAYAAYFLAEQLYLVVDRLPLDKKPAEWVSKGLSKAPYGRAMRLLRQTAARHSVPPPDETKDAKAVRERVAQWLDGNGLLLDIARWPEKHLRVTLKPTAPVFDKPIRTLKPMTPVFAALTPIEIEVRLQNISTVDIPLGAAGLCNPVVALRVNAETRGVSTPFANLPAAVLPAPRVLKAGAEVVTTVRIDVGAFEEYLLRRPLDIITLTVNSTLDPVQRGGQVASSLPTVFIAPAKFSRMDILGDFDETGDWAEQYQRTLQYTVNDYQNGTLEQRLSAARVIGSLLTVTGDMATRRMTPPPKLATAVQAPTLRAMFRAILDDPNVATRQEVLWALGYATLDGRLVTLMAPAFEDADPLARLRAVEVIGASRPPDYRGILERFLDDKDPMVRMVARAMLEQRRQPPSPSSAR